MSYANTATYDPDHHVSSIPAIAGGAVAGRAERPDVCAYSQSASRRPVSRYAASTAAWQLREESEDYIIPDLLSDKDYEPDPELYAAADAHTEGLRKAMANLDEATNLVGVLLASMEQDGDDRAMQAETVLKIVEKKLDKAHARIDRQDARHRNLFFAYFELKERSEKGAG